MSDSIKGQVDASKDRKTLAAELLEQALRAPGVQQLMTVYDKWLVAEQAAQPYRQIANQRVTTTASSTTLSTP